MCPFHTSVTLETNEPPVAIQSDGEFSDGELSDSESEAESETESEAESEAESEVIEVQNYVEKNVLQIMDMALEVKSFHCEYKKEHELRDRLDVWKEYLHSLENLPTSDRNGAVLDGALMSFAIHYLDKKYVNAFGEETFNAFIQRFCTHQQNIAEKSAALAESISAFEQEREFRIEEAKKKIQEISSDYCQSRKRNADHLNALEEEAYKERRFAER